MNDELWKGFKKIKAVDYFKENSIYQNNRFKYSFDIDINKILSNNDELKDDFNLVENYLRKQLEDIMDRKHPESIMFPEYNKLIDRLEKLEKENEKLLEEVKFLKLKIENKADKY